MFKIDDYYIGLIFMDPKNYNPIKAARYLGEINYDPFFEKTIIDGLVLGITVLLKKDNDAYHLLEYERFYNDLKVRLNEENRYGIDLRYIKPFKEVYSDDFKIYDSLELENNPELLEEAIMSGSYYVAFNKENNTYDIRIMYDDLDYVVRQEYFDKITPKQQIKK